VKFKNWPAVLNSYSEYYIWNCTSWLDWKSYYSNEN
jgi:hypothetical protein